MPKPAKLKDKDIQAWLDYLDSEITSLAAKVTALENKPATPSAPADITALANQVSINTAMVQKARADLDQWVRNAQQSIDSIDRVYALVKPLIEGDRTSAIEQVRQWPHK